MLSHSLSMLPLLQPNDEIEEVLPQNVYHPNDILVFLQNSNLIAHRLIHIFPNGTLLTQGDNNSRPDPLLRPKQVLGKLTKIKRKGEILPITHLYQLQSFAYQTELIRINQAFKSTNLPYLILKGLPLYLHYTKDIPQRLLCDLDLLVKPSNLTLALSTLESLGFTIHLSPTNSTQYTLSKPTPLAPIILDLHLEPAIAFTKLTTLNNLLPQLDHFAQLIWSNLEKVKLDSLEYPLLKPEAQFIYLLTHAFHHNFRGMHRWHLIHHLFPKLSYQRLKVLIKSANLDPVLYLALRIYLRLYPNNHSTPLAHKLLNQLSPTPFQRIIFSLLLPHLKPWIPLPRLLARLELLLLLLVTSPLAVTRRLAILFHPQLFSTLYSLTISRFFSSPKKLS